MYMYNKYIKRLNKISIEVNKAARTVRKKCIFRRALKVAKQADVLMLLESTFSICDNMTKWARRQIFCNTSIRLLASHRLV